MPELLNAYDLAQFPDNDRLSGLLAAELAQYGDANGVYAALGRVGLLDVFTEASPGSLKSIQATKGLVEHGVGAVVLRHTMVDAVGDQTAQLLSIALGCVYGFPTKTDRRKKQVAWPIRAEPDAGKGASFSQTQGEAKFHTDSAFAADPEDYFGLFCVASDVPGKGTNRFLRLEDIKRSLRERFGRKIFDELAEQSFPFRVPSVFTTTGRDSDVEISRAPIIGPGATTIRYRQDTITRALQEPGVEISDDQSDALAQLDSVLEDLPPIEYHLEPGDGIIVNNRKLLHARTAFDDPRRLLYRVRMREMAEA